LTAEGLRKTVVGGHLKILLNGEPHETPATTLFALCTALGLEEARVATALNGVFVPKGARGETPLADGDQVEIVAPRQGG
jgi:sulfur carrier protein